MNKHREEVDREHLAYLSSKSFEKWFERQLPKITDKMLIAAKQGDPCLKIKINCDDDRDRMMRHKPEYYKEISWAYPSFKVTAHKKTGFFDYDYIEIRWDDET